jgi:hypothetical protein
VGAERRSGNTNRPQGSQVDKSDDDHHTRQPTKQRRGPSRARSRFVALVAESVRGEEFVKGRLGRVVAGVPDTEFAACRVLAIGVRYRDRSFLEPHNSA